MRIKIDFSPNQEPITKERIQEMISWHPRRMKLSVEWRSPLHEPAKEREDWRLFLPFCQTLKNSFESMCFSVNHVGLRENEKGRCYTYIREVEENPEYLNTVQKWVEVVGTYVAIKDCLPLSFALDYDRENGDPTRDQTKIGKLRAIAKTYDRSPTADTYKAADNLASECLEFLENVECYKYSTCVVGMPPSKPGERYNLPAYLAKMVAEGLDKPNLSSAVETIKERPALKEVELAKKFEAIEGTISVNPDKLKGQTVLLLDDLYQSGITMNYVAMLLLEAGADKVFGLACEKTCSNDDNVSRGK